MIAFAGAFIAFAMGSGFASGQEIMRFFTAYGFPESLGGLCLALLVFAGTGAKVMADGAGAGLGPNQSIYAFYCGQRIGRIFELLLPLLMFCFLTVMLSGAGAAFHEYYGLPGILGRCLMALLVLFTVLLGLSRLVQILGVLGIGIVGTVTVVSLLGIAASLGDMGAASGAAASGTAQMGFWPGSGQAGESRGSIFSQILALGSQGNENLALLAEQGRGLGKAAPSWWISGILYGAFNVTTALPFLAGMGGKAGSRREAGLAGALGGGVFILGACFMNLCLLFRLDQAAGKQIPFLWVADALLPAFGLFFSILLLGGIYTTAAPLLWSICDGITEKEKGRGYKLTVLMVTVFSLIGSGLPFDVLVGAVYPATGWIGLFLLICVFFRRRNQR